MIVAYAYPWGLLSQIKGCRVKVALQRIKKSKMLMAMKSKMAGAAH